MKTIGLIGGMSWNSSIDYYRVINETTQEILGGAHSSKCIMYSVDFDEMDRIRKNSWMDAKNELVRIANKLKDAGADFLLICANTMHMVAEQVQEESGLRLLHIAEATGMEIERKGLKKVALLGTKYTMTGDFYKNILNHKFHIDVLLPNEEEMELINSTIYGELVKGQIKDESREAFKMIINRLMNEGAEGVILGCTEIPLLIKQKDVSIPVLDTTTIHAKAAVLEALNG